MEGVKGSTVAASGEKRKSEHGLERPKKRRHSTTPNTGGSNLTKIAMKCMASLKSRYPGTFARQQAKTSVRNQTPKSDAWCTSVKQFFFHLMDLLQNTESEAHDLALEITRLTYARDKIWSRSIFGIGDLSGLIPLMYTEDMTVRRVAARAVCNIVICGSKEQIWAANGVFPLLIQMSTSEEYMPTQKDAAHALCKLSEGRSAAQIRALVSQGCIRLLSDFIANGEVTIVGHALQALENVSFVCIHMPMTRIS